MQNLAAIAEIRFGLGLMAGQPAESDPRGALKAQLQGPDTALASAGFAGLPSGLAAMEALRQDGLNRRALLAAGTPLKGNFKPESRALYISDANAQLGWATSTQSSFRERLVWFWANHFTVSVLQGQTAPLVGAMIREAIRPHVTGNFTNMVLAAERHPAMLRYLANDVSVGPDSRAGQRLKRGLNENLGRECMELHTVGLKAGYSQADVTSMAKILTGWSVAAPQAGGQGGGDETGFKYRPFAHEPGPQTVMGHSFSGGEQAGVDALTFLSRYPTSYQMISAKLAAHFIADTPPPDAVARLTRVLMDSQGDLGAVSAALVDEAAAWAPLTKLKTPQEFLISTLRAAPPPAGPPVKPLPILAQLGQPLWAAPLPNGWPDAAANWSSSDALMARVNWAFSYAARFDGGNAAPQPAEIANTAMGTLLRPATLGALQAAGSRREAVTLLLASPEFQRR